LIADLVLLMDDLALQIEVLDVWLKRCSGNGVLLVESAGRGPGSYVCK